MVNLETSGTPEKTHDENFEQVRGRINQAVIRAVTIFEENGKGVFNKKEVADQIRINIAGFLRGAEEMAKILDSDGRSAEYVTELRGKILGAFESGESSEETLKKVFNV